MGNDLSSSITPPPLSLNDCADPSNIKLLLLGALRYLGRGHTFDDIEEATAISYYHE